jgi:hypothetical protein
MVGTAAPKPGGGAAVLRRQKVTVRTVESTPPRESYTYMLIYRCNRTLGQR